MGDVGHADDRHAAGGQRRAHTSEEHPRIAQVLQDVRGQDDVVAAADLFGDACVEVGLDERVHPFADVCDLDGVDARDLVAGAAEPFGKQPSRAAEVQDPARPPGRQQPVDPTV
ncbi:MAG TPA: hypothetical protein VFC03_22920 [Acidimicrobiales bacterium]|nr:hypothetical protein [Acidimicrobiales bacterium]